MTNPHSNHRYRDNGSLEKALGAVYTPPRVASALVRWAVRSPSDKVLDPACGEGVFLSVARTRLADLGSRHPTCVGVDIDPKVATMSGAICSDFFHWAKSAGDFDVIIGNPPFIRSHLFGEEARSTAFEQMREMGLRPSRLMSTWVPFIVLSCKLLSANGRIAFVVPEELLHVNYTQELRSFLLGKFRRVIVSFPGPDLFPSVQQAVVLLLCDNDPTVPSGLVTIPFSSLEDGLPYEVRPAPPWNWSAKWTHLFLSPKERDLVTHSLKELAWKPFKEYGRVEVGVVTGFNKFFILAESEARKLSKRILTPIITSARDLRGIELSADDFQSLVEQDRPLFLIHTTDPVNKLDLPLRSYLAQGIDKNIHTRYKCRIREPWYAVPSVWAADALMLRQAGEIPRLVHLTRKLSSTDTIHRVRWKRPSLARQHVAGFLNTWTLIACEIMGRSYGGGVLELMPSEANRIPIPPPLRQIEAIFDIADGRMRERKFYDAIEMVDNVVMPPSIRASELHDARNILSKLIARRKTRQNGND